MKKLKVKIVKTQDQKQTPNAYKTLRFIVDSNGGLTDQQIKCLTELIDGGFIEAINNHELIMHN